jgi:hypothetical protein
VPAETNRSDNSYWLVPGRWKDVELLFPLKRRRPNPLYNNHILTI